MCVLLEHGVEEFKRLYIDKIYSNLFASISNFLMLVFILCTIHNMGSLQYIIGTVRPYRFYIEDIGGFSTPRWRHVGPWPIRGRAFDTLLH